MSEYVRVPRAPTVEMIAATVDAVFGGAIEDASIIAEVYSAMVEAATAGQEPTDADRDYADMRRMQAALIAKTHECNELRALAAEQPQPEAPSGWIACSERMPPESTRVLVAHTGLSLFVRPGTWQDGEWWKDGGMALVGVVTHWRPLPPAPEGAGEKR